MQRSMYRYIWKRYVPTCVFVSRELTVDCSQTLFSVDREHKMMMMVIYLSGIRTIFI